MADLTVTAASVLPGANAIVRQGTAGETIAAGKVVTYSETTGKFVLTDTNHATAALRKATGIALNGASLNQPIDVQTGGDITVGATLTAGLAYYGSDTPGGICPVADIGSGEYVCLLGIAKSTTVLAIDVQFPNVAL